MWTTWCAPADRPTCAEAIDLIAGQKKEAPDERASTRPCLQEAVEGRGWTAGDHRQKGSHRSKLASIDWVDERQPCQSREVRSREIRRCPWDPA